MRSIDLANVLGLICGAIAIVYLGYQIDNQAIIVFGYFSLIIFVLLFLLNIILLIRDFKKHGIKMIPTDF